MRKKWNEHTRPAFFSTTGRPPAATLPMTLGLVLGVLLLTGGPASAITIVSTGVDTYISSQYKDECYGDPDGTSACQSATRPGDGIYGVKWDTSVGGGSGAEHGLLWFDISQGLLDAFAADPSATAVLSYTIFDDSSSSAARMHRMNVNWLQHGGGNDVTWNNVGCASGVGGIDIQGSCTTADSSYNSSAAAGTIGPFTVDVSTDVGIWAAGTANYGWGFKPRGSSGAGMESFESGTAPTLTLSVDAIPEPSTALLLGLGLLGLGLPSRKSA